MVRTAAIIGLCVLAGFGVAFAVAQSDRSGTATANTSTTVPVQHTTTTQAAPPAVPPGLAARFGSSVPALIVPVHRHKRHHSAASSAPATPAPVQNTTPAPTYTPPAPTYTPPAPKHHSSGGSGSGTITIG